ncbi:MAG: hypothetical protein HY329_27625 [Chloroflexi bacterium]|nr:hypothetical protein [Chloroflexota bacterium]
MLVRLLAGCLTLAVLLTACGAPVPQTGVSGPGAASSSSGTAATSGGSAPAGSSAPAPAKAAAPATPTRGGTFKMAVISDPIPYQFTLPGGGSSAMATKTLYNMLTRFGKEDQSAQPDLATKWEPSDNGRVWTFFLRKDVKWHDGQPFTADDVVFTYEKMVAKDSNAYSRSNFVTLEKVEAIDTYTVKMSFKEPYASLPVMTAYIAAIIPKHLLQNQDVNRPTEFLKNPIGTGPFKFKEFVPGDRLVVVANEEYHEGRPNLDSIIFRVMPDINTQVAQVTTGELDLAFPDPAALPALVGATHLEIRNGEQIQYIYIGVNHTLPQFSDKRSRQAMAYALDTKAIIDQVFQGRAIQGSTPISPFVKWAYNKDVKKYAYNPDQAKQLLSAAGWTPGSDGVLTKDGNKFKFTLVISKGNPTLEQIATIAQQQYKKVGIDLSIEIREYNQAIAAMRESKFEATMTAPFILPPDPDIFGYYGTGVSRNYWKYSNPDLDKLLLEGNRVVDLKQRTEIYHKVQDIIADDQPIIMIGFPYEVQAVNKRVQGLPNLGMRDAMLYAREIFVTK